MHLTLTSSPPLISGRPTRITRSTAAPVIQRVQVIDTETGEELKPLTLQDLVDALPAKVRRRLAALPAGVLRQLAELPRQAQLTLLGLPTDTQLAIIDWLQGPTLTDGNGAPSDDGAASAGAITPAGNRPERPASPDHLPPDVVDFLLGRARMPDWLGRIRVNMRRPAAAPRLLQGPPVTGGLRAAPDQTPEGRRRLREEYADHLAATRERPRPSETPVVASPEVAHVAAGHRARVDERIEHERDAKWSASRAKTHAKEARQTATTSHAAALSSANKTLTAMEQRHKPTGSRKDKRKYQKPQELLDAEQAVASLQTPPDLEKLGQQAERERLADLAELRKAKLSRDQIDALVTAVGSAGLHDLLAKNGAVAIARLASRLSAVQVASILSAAGGRLPNTLDDTIAAALPALFDAGASGGLIVTALKLLTDQMVVLVAQPAASCVKLLQVGNRPRLKLMCQGGQAANLAALAPLVSVTTVELLLECVDSAADLGSLCGPGPASLRSLLMAGVPKVALQSWCRTPIRQYTVQLLGRAELPSFCLILPALAKDKVGPVELINTLTAGAGAATVCGAVDVAPSLLKTSAEALQYLQTNPTHTVVEFRRATATAASNKASLAPQNLGQAQAESGATYTKWKHNAVLDCDTLHMLLNEGRARIVYESTFKTTTEKDSGGDTEEYSIETLDANGAWVTRWVVHLHRKFGDNKQQAPSASHLKRWEQRRLKDATRISIDSKMAARCREKNTD